MRASAKHLLLDQRLSESLPREWRCLWDQFHPRGIVNVEVGLDSDGQTWSHDLSVECLDISLAYHRFPYPLDKVRGQIRLREGVLDLCGMSALASGRPLRMEGQLLHPGPDCTGWFEFAVEDPVPLDEQLLSSLPGTSQQVVRSLQPHGSLTVWGRYERSAANPSVVHKRLEIGLRDCSMNYERFPYPLYRIRGTLSMSDDHWVFRDLQGGNDSGWVVGNGTWAPAPQGGTELLLDFNAMDVPLEDELRNALKPEAQEVWNSLCPRGTIDQLRVGVRYASLTRDLAVDVAAHKRPPEQNVEGRSITVKPSWLPYQWENVIGMHRCRAATWS